MHVPDRLPPHSQETEQTVLGCLMLDVNVAMPLCLDEGLVPDAFYDLRHRTIFEAILRLYDKRSPVELVSLSQGLRDEGQLEAVGGLSYLSGLADAAPAASAVGFYLGIILEKWRLRQMILFCTDTVSNCYDVGNTEEVFPAAESAFLKLIGGSRTNNLLTIKELVNKAIDQIELLHQRQGEIVGLKTGLIDLDKLSRGLKEGFYIIGARPGVGKTSLGMNIVEHIAVEMKEPVGVFSLEMSAESLVMRMLCSRARVNLRNVGEGFLADRDFPKLTAAASKIANSPIYIDDTAALPLLQLRARARRWQQLHGIKFLLVDYLQLVRAGGRNAPRTEQVTEISQGLKALSKELKIPVMALSQLNRDLEKTGRKPRLSDLRESGAAEQDADMIGLLSSATASDDDITSDCVPVDLDIAKQREGPTGIVNLTFLKSYTRFESAAKISDADYPQERKDLL